MLRPTRFAPLLALAAAGLPGVAAAHGGSTGWGDFIVDWLPFLVVVVGLGVYGMVKATHRRALDEEAPEGGAVGDEVPTEIGGD